MMGDQFDSPWKIQIVSVVVLILLIALILTLMYRRRR